MCTVDTDSCQLAAPPGQVGVGNEPRVLTCGLSPEVAVPEFIYTMKGVRKVVPPQREILKGIWLSFYHGAKIGVSGPNGAGKSTLLRIMAGIDREFDGEAFPAKEIKVGFLAQEPELDPAKTVLRERRGGRVAEIKALLDRFNAVSDRFAEPLEPEEMDKLLEEQAKLQDRIDAVGGWDLEQPARAGDGRAALPAGRGRRATSSRAASGAAWRCAACCCSSPTCCLLDEPTNHLDAESVAWLEHHLKDYPGTVVAITHDRYFLDNVAGWILELDRGAGIPWEGNYSLVARAEARPSGQGGEGAGGAPAHARARARVGAHGPARATGQEQGPPQGLRDAAAAGHRASHGARADLHPGRAAPGRRRDRGRAPVARATATGCSSTTCRSASRRAASSA